MAKMWFSKYALSDGIKEVEVASSMYEGYAKPVGSFTSYKIGKHLHEKREDAVKAARADRAKKIISLQKQIAKLEAMVIA